MADDIDDNENNKDDTNITNACAIKTLLKELTEFKKSNAELLQTVINLQNENTQLRCLLNGHDAEMPRKIAKKVTSESVNAKGDNDIHLITNLATDVMDSQCDNLNNMPNTSNNVNSASEAHKSITYMPTIIPAHSDTGVTNSNKKKIFQAVDTSLQVVRNTIKQVNCSKFVIQQTNPKTPVKITVQDAGEVAYIRDALAKKKISFHEFKRSDEKNKCFLIRGMVGTTDKCLPEIMHELVSAAIPAEASLSLFVTGYMRANPAQTHNSLLKLVLPPNFDVEILKSIKYINHVAIKFVAFKSQTVVQCKNCQRFGHTAGGCQHKHRCVKCGQDHLKDSCPRSFSKAVKLKCCNCGGEHSANNLSVCSFFAKNFPNKSAVVTNPEQQSRSGGTITPAPRSVLASGPKISNQSFASVAKGAAPNASTSVSSKLSELARKIYAIYALVERHEAVIQRFIGHE